MSQHTDEYLHISITLMSAYVKQTIDHANSNVVSINAPVAIAQTASVRRHVGRRRAGASFGRLAFTRSARAGKLPSRARKSVPV